MNSKICFYTPPFPGIQSQYDMIDVAVKHQVSAVEGYCNFEFKEADKEAAKKIREYADKKNIAIPCFSVGIDFMGENFNRNIEKVKGYADIAKILGSPYLHHTIAFEARHPERVIPYKREYYSRGIKVVKEIYDYAENIGVKAIYEPQGFIFNGIENFGNFISDVNRDVGVVADFGNIYQSGDNIFDFIQTFSNKISHVHLKDVLLNCDPNEEKVFKTLKGESLKEVDFGKGNVEFSKAINLLKEIGYTGYYSVEHSTNKNDTKLIDDMLQFVENLIS